jgi:hypothetical protein
LWLRLNPLLVAPWSLAVVRRAPREIPKIPLINEFSRGVPICGNGTLVLGGNALGTNAVHARSTRLENLRSLPKPRKYRALRRARRRFHEGAQLCNGGRGFAFLRAHGFPLVKSCDFALSSLRSLLFLSVLSVKSFDSDFDSIPPGGTHSFFRAIKTETGGAIL